MADPNIWSHEYASGQSSTDFPFPSDAQWIQAVGPGTIVLVMAGGAEHHLLRALSLSAHRA